MPFKHKRQTTLKLITIISALFFPRNGMAINQTQEDIAWFTSTCTSATIKQKLEPIKLVVLDIDGCLTDGQLYFPLNSEEVKGFSVQDGLGISLCIKKNISVAFLSGRGGAMTRKRAINLGIPEELCLLNIDNKKEVLTKTQQRLSVAPHETLYVGDDLVDLEVKPLVGVFACPQNALFYVQPLADIIIPKHGGFGAVRLLLDALLYCQAIHPEQQLITQAIKNSHH